MIAALGPEIARDSVVRKPSTRGPKQMIEETSEQFQWKRNGIARRNAIHLLAAAIGARTLARAVDDPRFSDETRQTVHDSLPSL